MTLKVSNAPWYYIVVIILTLHTCARGKVICSVIVMSAKIPRSKAPEQVVSITNLSNLAKNSDLNHLLATTQECHTKSVLWPTVATPIDHAMLFLLMHIAGLV